MTERDALSVSDAMQLAKMALEQVAVRVIGEVTNVSLNYAAAVYFTLKDEAAQMPCLMWRNAYELCGFQLKDGLLVEVSGVFSVYAPKGRMQFQVRQMTLAGEGALRMRVAALARKLEAEGLMAEALKRPLPAFPERIAVVTSSRGKAVHDVLRTLARRYPVAEVLIAGVQVEGEGAIEAIVEGLRVAGSTPGVDVVILCRGGGSYEDLMPFNSEEVARAVRACPVPVVTGIGHEPDVSIADLVADVHASTPTAAAERVAPAVQEIEDRLSGLATRLGRGLVHVLQGCGHRLELLTNRTVLSDPDALLASFGLRLDAAIEVLARSLPARLERDALRVEEMRRTLSRMAPRITERFAHELTSTASRFRPVAPRLVERHEGSVALLAAQLDTLSPLAVLARGYAVCYDATGAIVRRARDVDVGNRVTVRLAEGRLGCLVQDREVPS